MVGAACDRLGPSFAAAAEWGLLDSTEAQCFHIYAQLRPEALLLLAACLAIRSARTLVLPLCEQAVRDRERYASLLPSRPAAAASAPPPSALPAVPHVLLAERVLACCDGLVAWEGAGGLELQARDAGPGAAGAGPSSGGALPAGWAAASWQGRAYYWNQATQETTWTRPLTGAAARGQGELPPSTESQPSAAVSMQTLQGSDAALLAQRAVQLDGEGAAPAACAAYRAAAQALEDEAQLAAAEPQLQQSMLSRGASYRARAEELCVE